MKYKCEKYTGVFFAPTGTRKKSGSGTPVLLKVKKVKLLMISAAAEGGMA